MARVMMNPEARALIEQPDPAPIISQREYKARRAPFVPSQQQLDFFRWIDQGKGSAVLIAVAGAGKTTTLIQALPLLDGKVFFGAYNKSAAKDIRTKAENERFDRPGLFMGTVHAAGYGACRRRWKDLAAPDPRKVSKIIDNLINKVGYGVPSPQTLADAEALQSNGGFVEKMVSFGKQFLIDVPSVTSNPELRTWEYIIDHFSMRAEVNGVWGIEQLMPLVKRVYKISHDDCARVIDFDDMVYAPIAHDLFMYKNDWVILDEVQDINLAREELAWRMLKPSGRFIGVGDDRQSIYGFTGAGGGGIDRITKRFDAITLPLTVTYRCPQAVVSYVRQWVDHIQAHPSAPEGAVRAPVPSDSATWFEAEMLTASDAILCRFTKPLIKTAFALIRAGIACKIEGREIGKGLIGLACHWKTAKTLAALQDRLKAWLEKETSKARKGKDARREDEAQDRFDTMMVLIEKCRARGALMVSDLIEEIEQLFGDDVQGVVTLCTGHKSKGREWPRVYWLQAVGGRQPEQDWEILEESNIKYVIGTRAMRELILVPAA
jgi:DNA helicase-2/ATP-dependent DNA helicase PcrA